MGEEEKQNYEKQIGIEPVQDEETLVQAEVQQTPPTPPPPSHKKLIIGIVVAVFVVAGSVGAYFFVNQRGNTEPVVINEVESEIDDWKTYKIEREDVELSYRVPNEWSRTTGVDESEVFDFLLTPDSFQEYEDGSVGSPPDMTVTIVPNSSELTLVPFVGGYLGGWYTSYHEQSSVLIDGQKAMIVDDTDAARPVSPPKTVFIQVGTKMVIITFGWEVLSSSDEIVSSIKIGNIVDTSTWKTYSNEEFGFELKYPNNWTYDYFEATEIDSPSVILESPDSSRIVICPEGECRNFGFDPDTKIIQRDINVSDVETTMSIYLGEDNNVSIIFVTPSFDDYPDFQINYKPISKTSDDTFVEFTSILSTFKFIDSIQQSVTTPRDENIEFLLGEWSRYLDCANTVFTFKQNNVVELVGCDGDYQITSSETGKYTIADGSIIATFPESGDYNFTVVNDGNEQKLRLIRFEQEFLLFKVRK